MNLELKQRIRSRFPNLETEKYKNVIEKLSNNDYNLSFTSLKEFSHSPMSFIRYKAKEKVQTDAMKFGSLLHLLVLQPELFEEKYTILYKEDPNTTWGSKINKEHKLSVIARSEKEKIDVIDESTLIEALDLKDAVLGNAFAGDLIRGCNRFEQSLEWDWNGFLWKGHIDGVCEIPIDGVRETAIDEVRETYKIDLKKVTDARFEKLKWHSWNEKWHWQAYLYNTAEDGDPFADYYNVCVDGDGRVAVIKQDRAVLESAEYQILDCLEEFNHVHINELWYNSLEFQTDGVGYINASEL